MICAPPWFWGWSSYVPEGFLVTCSWDYTTRTLSNRLFYIVFLFFGFVLPVGVLIFCYSTILRFIVRHRYEMNQLMSASTSSRRHRQQTDVRTASIILMLALLYCVAWTPYAVVSAIGQFGPIGQLTPYSESVPAFFAKTAVVLDPILYGFSHPQFRSTLRQMVSRYSVRGGGAAGTTTYGGGTNNRRSGGGGGSGGASGSGTTGNYNLNHRPMTGTMIVHHHNRRAIITYQQHPRGSTSFNRGGGTTSSPIPQQQQQQTTAYNNDTPVTTDGGSATAAPRRSIAAAPSSGGGGGVVVVFSRGKTD